MVQNKFHGANTVLKEGITQKDVQMILIRVAELPGLVKEQWTTLPHHEHQVSLSDCQKPGRTAAASLSGEKDITKEESVSAHNS